MCERTPTPLRSTGVCTARSRRSSAGSRSGATRTVERVTAQRHSLDHGSLLRAPGRSTYLAMSGDATAVIRTNAAATALRSAAFTVAAPRLAMTIENSPRAPSAAPARSRPCRPMPSGRHANQPSRTSLPSRLGRARARALRPRAALRDQLERKEQEEGRTPKAERKREFLAGRYCGIPASAYRLSGG